MGGNGPPERGNMKAKYKNMPITTIRTFSESPARWFLFDGKRVSKTAMTYWPYKQLEQRIKRGQIQSVHRIG